MLKRVFLTVIFICLMCVSAFSVDFVAGGANSSNYCHSFNFTCSGTSYTVLMKSDPVILACYPIYYRTAEDQARTGFIVISEESSSSKLYSSVYYSNGNLVRNVSASLSSVYFQKTGPLAGYYVRIYDTGVVGSPDEYSVSSNCYDLSDVVDDTNSYVYERIASFFFSGDNGFSGNESGSEPGLSDSWGNSEQSTFFGNWFNSIFDGLSNIINTLKEGFQSLLNGIGKFFSDLLEGILDGIKRFFIPDSDVVQGFVDEITACFKNTFGFDGFDISSVVGSETAFNNINGTIKYGKFEFSGMIVDFSFVLNALTTFKPYIRAFIAFLICIYNINQFLGVIGCQSLSLGVNVLLGKDSVKEGDSQ